MAKWVDLGTVRVREFNNDDGTTAVVRSIVFDKNVKILARSYDSKSQKMGEFQEVDLGQFRNAKLQDPLEKLNKFRDNEWIDESKYESDVEFINEKGVKYNIVVPPAKD